MKKILLLVSILIFVSAWLLTQFNSSLPDLKVESASLAPQAQTESKQKQYGEFKSQAELGEHLVMIAGCHDCHTPKKMTPTGPELDFSLALSGHPSKMPPPDVNRKEMEQKGLAVTQTLTSWVGPWGISYAANLTSDKTGIGEWKEENFIIAMREGKFKGLRSARNLLPPMPWQMLRHMTDEELKAIFAYLQTTKPIQNVVPPPQPPLAATTKK